MYRKVEFIFITILGSFIEFFDFTVYNFFSAQIAAAIFPHKSAYISMLLAFSIFALGFVIRPLGGIILGYIADKKSRTLALYWSMMLMAAANLLLCCLPSFAMIGTAAPVLLILARLCQGFATGGESSVASSLLIEAGYRPGLFLSFQFMAQGLSSFLGAAFAAGLNIWLSHQQLYDWGWRLPFLAGLCLTPLALMLRRYSYMQADKRPDTTEKTQLKQYWGQIFLSIMSILPTSVAIYCMVFYMPHFLNQIGFKNAGANFLITSYAGLFMAFGALLGGLFCDRVQRQKALIVYLLGAIAGLAYISFTTLAAANSLCFISSYLLCVTHIGMLMTVSGLFILQVFPTQIRARSNAISYCIGVALFGGTTNMVITALQHYYHNNYMAFYYLLLALTIGAVVFLVFPKAEPYGTK